MNKKRITIPQANTNQIGNIMEWAVNKVSEKYKSSILYVIFILIIILCIIGITQRFF